MIFSLPLFIEALILILALSVDTFVASFAYGTDRIKIPIVSILIINTLCSVILVIFLLLGNLLSPIVPQHFISFLCFFILFALGLLKLFDSSIKIFIRKLQNATKNVHFSLKSLQFILTIYAKPQSADSDQSATLSPTESISLGIALSLDSAVVGIGTGIEQPSYLLLFLLSFSIGFIVIYLGDYLGEKIAGKFPLNLSWVSGILLIFLAFLKLF